MDPEEEERLLREMGGTVEGDEDRALAEMGGAVEAPKPPKADLREVRPEGTVTTGQRRTVLELPERTGLETPAELAARGATQVEEREVRPMTAAERVLQRWRDVSDATGLSRIPQHFGIDPPSAQALANARSARAGGEGVVDSLLGLWQTAERPEGMAPSDTDRRTEAGGLGVGEGTTLGFLDETQGVLRALPGVASSRPEPVQALGVLGWLISALARPEYRQGRDEARARLAQAREQAPGASLLGQAAPALAAGLGGGPTASTALGRVAQAALAGGGLGAVVGAGQAEEVGDLPSDVASGAALGALTSAGGQALGEGVSGMLRGLGHARPTSPITRDIEDLAATDALRARGLNPDPAPTSPLGRDLQRFPGGREGFARYLQQQRIGGRFPTPQSSAEAAQRLESSAGQRIGDLAQQLDEAGPVVDMSRYAQQLDDLARGMEALPNRPVQAAGAGLRRDLIDPLLPEPSPLGAIEVDPAQLGIEGIQPRTFSQAHALRRSLDDAAGSWQLDPSMRAATGQAQEARGILSQLMDEAAEEIDPLLRGQWRRANRDFQASQILQSRARPTGSNLVGAMAEGIDLSAATTGNPAALAGAAASRGIGRVFSNRLPGIRANVYYAIANRLAQGSPRLQNAARILQDALQRGPQAAAATHFLLSQRDPEYRAAVEAAEQEASDNE